ncbi:MAG: alkaline phosphatase family protein, partial [Anaerolineales bacterium]
NSLLAFIFILHPAKHAFTLRPLPHSQAPTHPVLLFVTDGGRPDHFRQYAAQGLLPAYARLQAEGAMGLNGMIPQLPTSSRVGWNTISTGAWGGTHGSINNVFTRRGLRMSEGLAFGQFSELEAETLPEAAERAGRKVLMFDWNSSDQPAIAGPTVKYWESFTQAGVAQNYDDPERAAQAKVWGLMFERLSLSPISGGGAAPATVSPLIGAILQLFDTSGPSYQYAILFYDSTNDGQTNYDRAALRAGGQTVAEVGVGEWAEVRVKIANGEKKGKTAGFYLKLMELSPYLDRVKFFVTPVSRVRAQPADLEDALADNFPTRAGAGGPLAWTELIDEATYSESAELTTAFNVKALPWLLSKYAPDTDLALVGYINTDVLQHAMLALVTPETPVYDDANRDGKPDGRVAARTGFLQDAYVGADRTLAAAWDAMPPGTIVFAASDHGFAATWKAVYAPRVLADAGLQPEPQTQNCLAPESVLAKACWVGGAAMIYLNVRGREPNGVIPPENYESVRNRVIAAWRGLKDEAGRPVAAAVFTREQAAALPDGGTSASMFHPHKTGDVIVFLNLPYQFDFAEGGTPIRDTTVWWGAHGHLPQSGVGAPNAELYATFYAAGPGIRHHTPNAVRAIDLAPTIAYLLGIPAPAQAEGRVLKEILKTFCAPGDRVGVRGCLGRRWQ